MHLIKDENGNVCPHSHASSDCNACENHDHHEHHTDHVQEDPNATPEEKMAAVLDYMLKHNEHHAAELDQMAGKLAADNRKESSDDIRKAVDEFQKGNMYLSLALSAFREGK